MGCGPSTQRASVLPYDGPKDPSTVNRSAANGQQIDSPHPRTHDLYSAQNEQSNGGEKPQETDVQVHSSSDLQDVHASPEPLNATFDSSQEKPSPHKEEAPMSPDGRVSRSPSVFYMADNTDDDDEIEYSEENEVEETPIAELRLEKPDSKKHNNSNYKQKKNKHNPNGFQTPTKSNYQGSSLSYEEIVKFAEPDLPPEYLQWRAMLKASHHTPRLLEMMLWPLLYGTLHRYYTKADVTETGSPDPVKMHTEALIDRVGAGNLRHAKQKLSKNINYAKTNGDREKFESLRLKIQRWILIKEFYQRNVHRDVLKTGSIDLHGQSPQDARMLAKFFINFFQARLDKVNGVPNSYSGLAFLKKDVKPVTKIEFIVGKGKHAHDSYSKVRDAVETVISYLNYSHRLYERRKLQVTIGEDENGKANDGVLVVTLPK